MWLPKNISIQSKLTLVMLMTCTAALVAAFSASFAFQLVNFRQTFKHDLSLMADIIANSSTGTIKFDNSDDAEENLSALRVAPQVVSAEIFLPNGTSFATYGRKGDLAGWDPAPSAESFHFVGGMLVHYHPILLKNKRIGRLYLWSDYNRAFADLLRFYAGTLAVVLSLSILVALLVSSRLQRYISGPILKLAEAARLIGERNDYSIRAQKFEDDEVGRFTDAFNHMLDEIESQAGALHGARQKLADQVSELRHEITERQRAEAELRELHGQLLETSRRAGMAEVATGVLHNVGNVLNSVNVSTGLISETLRKSKTPNLAKAAALLREHEADLAAFLSSGERGRVLPAYLAEISDRLVGERLEMLREIDLLHKNIEHIKDIVAMQQNYAKVSGLVETLPVDQLVEDAIEMDAASLERHQITLVRDYADVPPVAVDKHKVIQILINLIRNAHHALKESSRDGRRIVIGIGRNGSNRVKVIVSDNGVGIPPENLTRIFSHGFTTRKDGHGFGLHAGALAAQELGGRLAAHSDGTGAGATFTLELPIAKETEHDQPPAHPAH